MVLFLLRPNRMARDHQVNGSQATEMTCRLPDHHQVGGEAT
jgi:hypothetical protein